MNLTIKVVSVGQGFHTHVEILVNNYTVRMLLDTGASETIIGEHAYSKFRPYAYSVTDEVFKLVDGTALKVGFAVYPVVQIGDAVMRDKGIKVFNLSALVSDYHDLGLLPVDGILGNDLLIAHQAIVDYGNRELTFNAEVNYNKK